MINMGKWKQRKLNNKGSALVVVIITIAFVCILATLILYLSVMNYQMKSTDYRTKVSFYGAETPLEELRVILAVDASNAAQEAYLQVMTQYGLLNDGSGDSREAAYSDAMLAEFEDIWKTRNYDAGSGTTSWLLGMRKAFNDTDTDNYHFIEGDSDVMTCTDADCDCPYHIIVVNVPGNRLTLDEQGVATLEGIKVTYTENSFTSVISTDFRIYVPEYDWSVEKYSSTWTDGTSTITRQEIDYEKCVVYLNYLKQ